ncbi:MAG TPA: hypothetical protein VFQ85_06405 [Mycobacteriales bacterium]|jgi:hypothetical protein|nr:hypothetical protein [Mycobacteriales bacterium]
MTLLRRLVVLCVLLVTAGLGAGVAHACSCVPSPPLDRAVAESPVAFAGTITDRSGDRYVVRVESILKGSPGARVTLRAWDERSNSCGVRLPLGPILFAGDLKEPVHLCSTVWTGDSVARVLATSRLSPSPLPPSTDRPQAVGDTADSGGHWVAAGGAVAGVLLGAVAIGAARRRAT